MQRFKRKLSVTNIINQRIRRLALSGRFFEAFGNPQDRGVWFIWGTSASGKSSFIMKLAKHFAEIGYSVYYNLLEEDPDDSDYIDRVKMVDMFEVKDKFHTIQANYDELITILKKRRSPKVIIIDSLPYFNINWEQYLELKRQFRNKIFVFVGHAKGTQPRTKIEEDVMFDAKMKIFVSGFLAVCKGRTIGPNGGNFIVWDEGYKKIQGTQTDKIN